MPIPQDVVEDMIGYPDPQSPHVQVRTDELGSVLTKTPRRVSLDGRRYILDGVSILPSGREIPSKFEIDTRRPELLDQALWAIDGKVYESSEPAVLAALGLTHDQVYPFRWATHVPLRTGARAPYEAGQPISRKPWWKVW